MRIGEFAKRFGLNVSTVRYYISNGLLVPGKKARQYDFNSNCVEDMKKILKYKSYHFSLEEIQLLFFLEKTSRFRDDVVLKLCSEILENKRKELVKKRDELNRNISSLKNEIDAFPKTAPEKGSPAGVPFSFIPYLYCPRCQVPLKLDSASISEGFLQKGKLWCECGYQASIENGIILCGGYSEDTPFRAFENIDSVLAMTVQFSPAYRLLIEQASLYMYNKIYESPEDPMFVMTGPFTLNFILSYIEKLNRKNTYIITDPSKKRIEKLRSYLSGGGYNIVYLTGSPEALPVKNGIVDIFIDDFCTVNSMFTFNTFEVENIAPLMKKASKVSGIFGSYAKAPKSIEKFKAVHPEFDPGKMTLSGLEYSWEQGGFGNFEKKHIGLTSRTSPDYPQDVIGEQVEVLVYTASKGNRKKL